MNTGNVVFVLIESSKPVFTYLKSRGFYAGVQVDGTVIIERTDENERFYGQRIGVADILAGKIRHPPYELKLLMETVKSAEGRSDVDRAMLAEIEDQPAPGDVDLQAPGATGSSFGIPEIDDPDPFGVLALENAGLEIREAGSLSRPSSTQFEYNPSPTSPIYGKFLRRMSMDTLATRSNRESYMSNRSSRPRTSTDRATQTAEMGTQTADFSSPSTSPALSAEVDKTIEEEVEVIATPEEIDYTKIDLGPIRHLTEPQYDDLDNTTTSDSPRTHSDSDNRPPSRDTSLATDDEFDEDDLEDEEEAVIFEAASTQATIITPQVIKARGGVVNIPKRPPPPALPPRNALRSSRTSTQMVDQVSGQTPVSPTKDGFEEVPTFGADRRSVEVEGPLIVEDKEVMPSSMPRFTLSNGVELDLNVQHTMHSPMSPTVAADLEKDKLEGATKDDEDTFHSVPTTPMEQGSEVKAN